MATLIEALRREAAEIAKQGINGWGNLMTSAADELEDMAETILATRPEFVSDHEGAWELLYGSMDGYPNEPPKQRQTVDGAKLERDA